MAVSRTGTWLTNVHYKNAIWGSSFETLIRHTIREDWGSDSSEGSAEGAWPGEESFMCSAFKFLLVFKDWSFAFLNLGCLFLVSAYKKLKLKLILHATRPGRPQPQVSLGIWNIMDKYTDYPKFQLSVNSLDKLPNHDSQFPTVAEQFVSCCRWHPTAITLADQHVHPTGDV